MGLKSRANSAFLILSFPYLVNTVPVRAVRVGSTQSNISMPLITPSTRHSGDPTPIKYLGLSFGIIGTTVSSTSYINSFGSPTDNPPTA